MFVSAVLVAVACVVSYFIWSYIQQRFLFGKLINMPGPRKLSNFYPETPNGILDFVNKLGSLYPSPFQISVYYMPIYVVLHDPNQIKTILQFRYCLNKGKLYKFVKPLVGMGLGTVSESMWSEHRKIIAPNFNSNMVREIFNVFVKHSLMLANELGEVGSNGNEIILHKHILANTVNVVCATMGIEIETDIRDKFIENIERFKDIYRCRLHSIWLNPFLYFNTIFNLTTLGREQQKIVALIDSFINKITQQQLQQLNKLHSTETKTNTINKTVFDKLMETFRENNFTEKLIRDNIITLMMAASDTSSITLNFVFFMLANFPEIQEKVYKELSEIYGTEMPMSAPVKYEDIQHMHYMDRVIKETMRLFPGVPVINRQLSKDIKIGDSILPKNTNVALALMWMYRNEKYWPNPLKFDPDRFLPERIKNSYYYIPFSDGPRNCIGAKYAMISMKVIIATLVRTFVFKVDKSVQINEIKLKADILLSTIEPLKVRIEKRDL